MKKIVTQGPFGDEFESWRQKAQIARQQMLHEYFTTGKIPEPNSEVLRYLKENFLIKIFHSKCAYCESRIPIESFPGFVDHYRPRKAVTVNRKRIDHPGYFWLTYEWDNLLPVCHNCNTGHGKLGESGRISHPGKSMEFPIRGERVMAPSDNQTTWTEDLKKEIPLILNPYYDEPREHIAFDNLGVPYAKDGSERGLATIETCDLARDDLCQRRRDYANDLFMKRAVTIIVSLSNRKVLETREFLETSLCCTDDDFSSYLNHAMPMYFLMFAEMARIKIEGNVSIDNR
jgi:hypothetical protein